MDTRNPHQGKATPHIKRRGPAWGSTLTLQETQHTERSSVQAWTRESALRSKAASLAKSYGVSEPWVPHHELGSMDVNQGSHSRS